MAGDSGQKFIRRNRPPRVHITYEDPYNADQKIELPFVMGVLADLSGNASEVEKSDIGERKFLDVDMDNFDQRPAQGSAVRSKSDGGAEGQARRKAG
jgi:type VI secretion system protein ImpB